MSPRETYEAGVARAEAWSADLERRIRGLGLARIVVAMAGLGGIAAIVWGHAPAAVWGLVAFLAVLFVALVIVHGRAFAAKERAVRMLAFHQRGLARLGAGWRSFASTGAGRAPPDHPFADDLDLFGRASLFQLLDATETPFGQDALAAWLLGASQNEATSWPDDLRERQSAVRDVAGRVEWRERLAVEGALLRVDAPDPERFLAWAEGRNPFVVPAAVVVLARVLPFLVLAVWLGSAWLGLPRWSWVVVVAAELAILRPYRAAAAAIAETVSADMGGFSRYRPVFEAAVAGSSKDTSLRLASLLARLSGPTGAVTREMAALERIVGFIEARRNEVFRLFLGPVLMWDLNFVVLLERWRTRQGGRIRSWFLTLGELEAYASLGGFAFDRPDHAWPELDAQPQLRAMGLGHPLIDAARRVGNDVTLPGPGTALVVTGSNMSGKSTLLRALGTSTVLAQIGAPVAASAFALGPVALATSMRIRDSLEEGVSHFYAEIKKLKRVVDLSRTGPPVLFLLDEILHGTNSRERIIGARAVVEDLIAHGALGAVSTHDLGIAALGASGDAPGSKIRNVHFEEQVEADGTMTFDYRLREGLVQSSNALRLMRAIGLDVPIDGPGPDRP